MPDIIKERSSVFVYMQNPGGLEEEQGIPAVGKTGDWMDRQFIPQTGMTRDDLSIGNVLRCRWPDAPKGKPNELPQLSRTIVRDAITHCQRAHFKIPEQARVIVSQGDYALWGLTGQTSSTDWRGYALSLQGQAHLREVWVPRRDDVCILATVHLARLFREPTLTLATMADWGKVARVLRGSWPRPAPSFETEPPQEWPARFAFDTEYVKETHRLIRYSLATEEKVHVVERDDHSVPRFPGSSVLPTVITQYAPADIRHLESLARVNPWQAFVIDDTVWKHSTLYSDHSHDLNYLGSIYSSMNRWKHLADVIPQEYAGADAWGTLEVDDALNRELARDPRSKKVWEEIDRPALEHMVRAQYRGLRVDRARVREVSGLLEIEVAHARHRAIASVGWPINIGSSKQVGHRLFKVEGLRATKAPR